MKKVKQFRYYGEDNALNYPEGISLKTLVSGSIFTKTKVYPIVQLGVQTLPGIGFYLNKGNDPVIVDASGIFTLNLSDGIEISSLSFDLESMNLINENDEAYLVIDIIYNV